VRVVILTRVSTTRQDAENQIFQLRQFCNEKKYIIVKEIKEHVSGSKSQRPGIDTAIEMASQGRYDLLLFWNLDRFSRFGIPKTLHYFDLLESYGVQIKSFTQPYLDTSNDMLRPLLLAVFSYIASFQLARYSEDIKAGQARARKQGKRIGRPKLSPAKVEKILKLRAENLSFREIGRKLNISDRTVRQYANNMTLQKFHNGQVDLT
jgi:DNA invertase Pin-like site-specific DNA recombinase